MARTIINNPALPRSKSPHSNAVKVGNLIFVSGFPGYDENVKIPQGDFAQQMRHALQHIKATLEYAGSWIDKIAKVNVYLDRRADFDEMNEIYKEFFGSDQSGWPARTTVEARPAQGFSARNRLRRRGLINSPRPGNRRPPIQGA